MKKISKYILRELVVPFFMSLGVILFLFVLNIVMKMMTSFAGKGIEIAVILEFFYLSMGWILALAVPMSVLVAALMAYGRLAQDNEWSVMQSSGISVYQVLAPTLVLAGLLSYGMMFFHNEILPEMNHRNKVLKQSIKRKKPLAVIEPGIFVSDIPGYVLKVEEVDHEKNTLGDIVIIESDKGAKYSRTITAKTGKITYGMGRYHLVLNDGEIANLDTKKPEGYQKGVFTKMIISIEDKGVDFEVKDNDYYGDREKSVDSLRATIAKMKKSKAAPNRIASVEIELYKKYALSFACFVMVLVGAPLGLMSGRSGLGASASLSILIFTIYWFFLLSGEDLGDRGKLDPILAMWNANIIIGVFGLYLIYHASKGTKISFDFIKAFWYWITSFFKKN